MYNAVNLNYKDMLNDILNCRYNDADIFMKLCRKIRTLAKITVRSLKITRNKFQ